MGDLRARGRRGRDGKEEEVESRHSFPSSPSSRSRLLWPTIDRDRPRTNRGAWERNSSETQLMRPIKHAGLCVPLKVWHCLKRYSYIIYSFFHLLPLAIDILPSAIYFTVMILCRSRIGGSAAFV